MKLERGECPLFPAEQCDCDGYIRPGDMVFYQSGENDGWVRIWGYGAWGSSDFWIGRGHELDPLCIQDHAWYKEPQEVSLMTDTRQDEMYQDDGARKYVCGNGVCGYDGDKYCQNCGFAKDEPND
jgi:hypothetical protein